MIYEVAGSNARKVADYWKKEDLRNSTYVWLPIRFQDSRMYIEWKERWDLSFFDGQK